MLKVSKASKGFTLIEILVVIGIIAVLATIVIVAINPARQFAQANNTQRTSNVNTILNGVGQYIADNKGQLPSSISALAANATTSIASGSGNVDLCSVLVPTYMSSLPVDPTVTSGAVTNCSSYNTEYDISHDVVNRVTVCTSSANLEAALPGSTIICVTR